MTAVCNLVEYKRLLTRRIGDRPVLATASARTRFLVVACHGYYRRGIEQLGSPYSCRPLLAVVIAKVLPEAFGFLARSSPDLWTAQHKNHIAEILHVLLLLSLAPENTDLPGLVAVALVMVSFDMFQRALDWDAKLAGKSDSPPHASSVAETPVTCTSSVHHAPVKSGSPISPIKASEGQTVTNPESGVPEFKSNVAGPKEDIVRLQGALTEECARDAK
jgi:hypothetical protein